MWHLCQTITTVVSEDFTAAPKMSPSQMISKFCGHCSILTLNMASYSYLLIQEHSITSNEYSIMSLMDDLLIKIMEERW